MAAIRKNNPAKKSMSARLFALPGDLALAKRLDRGLDEVEARLARETQFGDAAGEIVAGYLLQAGGKRVRPALAMLAAQYGDGITEEVLTASVAVELTHLATLYHDDVMDEAELRRGVPSAQQVYGNSIAILAGDLLFARSSSLFSSLGPETLAIQAQTFERLVLGQLHETVGPQDGDDPIEHYIQVLADKTGSLIASAAHFGLLCSNAPREFFAPVREYGEKVGIAFQLADDVIDLSPASDATGKLAGTDLRSGVPTLPLLLLRAQAEQDAEARTLLADVDALVGESADDDHLASVVTRVREHEVTRRTTEEAQRYAREAVAALAPLPDGVVKRALTEFADTVAERTA